MPTDSKIYDVNALEEMARVADGDAQPWTGGMGFSMVGASGKTVRCKKLLGTVEQFPTKASALRECEPLRKTINRDRIARRTLTEVVNHFQERSLAVRHSQLARPMPSIGEAGLYRHGRDSAYRCTGHCSRGLVALVVARARKQSENQEHYVRPV
jgi:hypothetical protein